MAVGGDDADTPFTDLRYMWYETVGVPRIYKSLWKSFSQRIKKETSSTLSQLQGLLSLNLSIVLPPCLEPVSFLLVWVRFC